MKPHQLTCARDSLPMRKIQIEYADIHKAVVNVSGISDRRIITQKDMDEWDVKALSHNLVPVTTSSPVIQKYLERKNQKHQETITEMYGKLEELNVDVECLIRKKSDIFKLKAEELDRLVAEVEQEFYRVEWYDVEPQDFSNFWKNICSLEDQRKTYAEELHQILIEIENDRTEKTKTVLRKYFDVLGKVACKLPSELQDFFEHEILKINQVKLNNLRCYADLFLQLSLVADKEKFRIRDRLKAQKQLWLEKKKEEMSKTVTRMSHDMPTDANATFESTYDATLLRGTLRERMEVIGRLLVEWKEKKGFTVTNVEELIEKLRVEVQKVDDCAKSLVEIYKRGLVALTTGMYNHVDVRCQKFLEFDLDSEENVNEFRSNIRESIVTVESQISVDVEELQKAWEVIIDTVETTIQDVYSCLLDAAALWDSHYQKIRSAKEVVTACVNQMMIENDREMQDYEVKLNVAMDVLRQEATEAKIEKDLVNVNGILDEMKQRHETNRDNEKKAVEEYSNLINTLPDSLNTDINAFLEKTSEFYPEIFYHEADSVSLVSGSCFLTAEMDTVQTQLASLLNWKSGLEENIKHQAPFIFENTKADAEKWVKEKCDEVNDRYEAKLMLHMPRYDRVLYEIYNARLAEIKNHTGRLNSHITGTKKYLAELLDDLKELVDHQNNLINELDENLSASETSAKEALRSHAVQKLVDQCNQCYIDFSSGVRSVLWEFQRECDNKISWIRESNLNFIKSIRLFSEGGNFSADEARDFSTQLGRIDGQIDKQEGAVMKQIDDNEITLLKNGKVKTDRVKESLKQILEDLQFGEKAVELIKNVQNIAKTEVTCMKYNAKLISSNIEEISHPKMPDIVESTELKIPLKKRWLVLVDAITKYHDYLAPQSESDKPLEEEAPGITATTSLRFGGIEEVSDKRKSTLQKLFRGPKFYLDYREVLFGSPLPPPKYPMFLSNICCTLWNVFSQLQELACDYYSMKGSKTVIKTDIIHPVYDNFIEELLLKFKYYHVQCEDVWLDQIKDFLNMVENLKQLANNFVQSSLTNFFAENQLALSQQQECFMLESKQRLQDDQQKRDALGEKLKPLYGYPGNSSLLQSLNEEVISSSEEISTTMTQFFDCQIEGLRKTAEAYEPNANEFIEPLLSIIDQLFKPSLTEDLVSQLNEPVGSDTNTVREKFSVLRTADTADMRRRSSIMNKRVHNLGSLHSTRGTKGSKNSIRKSSISCNRTSNSAVVEVPCQYRLSLERDSLNEKNRMTRIEGLHRECLRLSQLGPMLSSTLISEKKVCDPIPKQLVVPEPFNVKEEAAHLSQEYSTKYKKFKKQMEKQKSLYLQMHKDWIKDWSNSVMCVKKLYAIPVP